MTEQRGHFKVSVHQKDKKKQKKITNMYEPNTRASKWLEAKTDKAKGENRQMHNHWKFLTSLSMTKK